jgi:hypothetical protein
MKGSDKFFKGNSFNLLSGPQIGEHVAFRLGASGRYLELWLLV